MKDRSTSTFRPYTTVRQGSKHLAAQLPTDLVGVIGFVTLAVVLLTIVDVSNPLIRAGIGFPFLFLVPGYATVAALFPRAHAHRESVTTLPLRGGGVSPIERVALAFGLSFAVLPLLGLAIAAASWGFSTSVVVAVIAGYALVAVWIAAIRRSRVPVEDRYRFSLLRSLDTAYASIVGARTTVHTAVNVLLVASMLIALTSVGYALVAPQQGEQYTSLEILTEDDAGELVTAHPDEIESGASIPLTAAVGNHEGTDAEYTVVVQEQWLSDGDVIERTELDRGEYAVSAGETAHGDHDVEPVAEDGDVRIAVLLYEGDDVPDTPTTDNAYRYGYFWTEVVDDADVEE
ncbi:DUF1616 domain-containing protein [Natrarchaeobius oligotrophus]|uniref:DUF1616 domain-containing protein n=1 Tax=Natrarchaeobius chitinivorans TaxID=1679083 RepID=A0A3N6MGV4_NATCH|nr:DUF1616 domain-containing protein [Natrarchaeobius chitinivorans]RQH00255.1 DUF1616 domain-containing protein [Natrarchaeobius chitinivorans]